MVGVILVLMVAVVLIGTLVYVMGWKDRYADMTEEEFEREAKEKSLLGAAMMGVESVLRKRETAILMEAKSRVEREATPSPGDLPEEKADPSLRSG